MTTLKPESRDDLVELIKRGRRSRKRGKAIERAITQTIVSSIMAFFGGWEFMLAVGIIHAEWIRQLPTIGYWWSVLLVFLLKGVFSITPSSKDKDDV